MANIARMVCTTLLILAPAQVTSAFIYLSCHHNMEVQIIVNVLLVFLYMFG